MTRMLRGGTIAIAGLIGLGLLGYALIYAVSEHILRRTYEIPTVTLAVPTDSESIQEGRRLATIRGCFMDCHGKQAEGRVMFDDPKIARIVAPNLTAAVHQYGDSQLAVIIRNGLRPDGRSLLIMPNEAFVGMTDADVGKIIAFLKSLPPLPGPGRSVSVGPLGQLGLLTGQFKTSAQRIALAAPPPAAVNQDANPGRYLARTICAECHGTDLRGDNNPEFSSPDLVVVASYSQQDFTRLLATGVAIAGRELGIMSEQARTNLSQLSASEISSLYSYLHNLPPNTSAH